jgi:hypothetical protein
MMNAIPLTVPFKGNRTYIHSTDVYPAILNALAEGAEHSLGEFRDVDFMFRRICGHQVQISKKLPENETAIATFSFLREDKPEKWFVFERNEEVTERVKCPEAGIIETSQVDLEARAIRAPYAAEPKGTLIETIVALNKALHQSLFSDAGGKWLFTQIETARPLRDIEPNEVEIRLVQQFGLRLTKSEIRFDGAPEGHIFFSHLKS